MYRIRFATIADTQALLSIYNPYIETTITFETVLPTVEDFSGRIKNFGSFYPYLVCENDDGKIIGYAYAHRQNERTAYQWDAEVSIYLDINEKGKGIGTNLYSALIDMLKLQNVKTLYSLVTVPNDRSKALHEKFGFKLLAVHKNTGYKNGTWRDVMWLEATINDYDEIPTAPLSIHELDKEEVQNILEKYSVK